MGLSPLPQHSFPGPKLLFESDRSSTPRWFQVHKRAGYSLPSKRDNSFLLHPEQPQGSTPARSLADSYSLCTVGCFCWAPPEGSARYNLAKQKFWPQNPTPRNSDLLANPLIISSQIAVLFKICSLFKRSYWLHHRITWGEWFPVAI